MRCNLPWTASPIVAAFCSFLVIGLPLLMTPTAARGQQRDALSSEAIAEGVDSAIAALRAGGTPPEISAEPVNTEEPPAPVAAAGAEFVAAWREYRRACAPPKPPSAGPGQPADLRAGKNVLSDGLAAYQGTIQRLLKGDKPPTPDELEQFYYASGSWCGNDGDGFYAIHEQAVLLACVKNRGFHEAARMVLYSPNRAALLGALGYDWQKVVAGAWLDGQSGQLEALCKDGSDVGARLALRWAQLHWEELFAAREAQRRTGVYEPVKGPEVPTTELLLLLRADNAVTPAVKQSIADFLNENALRLKGVDWWLGRAAPPGAAPYLKPIARAALQAPSNGERLLGEETLREAGEKDAKADLQLSPRFRLFINGILWKPGAGGMPSRLGIEVKRNTGGGNDGMAADAQPDTDGVLTVDPDYFLPPETIRRASFYSHPFRSSDHPPSMQPWIEAAIPLPPRFGETTDLHVETTPVTIRPRLPRPAAKSPDKRVEVEFGLAPAGGEQAEEPCVFPAPADGSLTLAQVQPGDYLMSVRAPGAAAWFRQKVRVEKGSNVFEPALGAGSDVTVPLEWFGLVIDPALDPLVAKGCLREFSGRLPGFFTVERDGTPLSRWTEWALPERLNEPIERLVLRNLPAGNYRVRLPSSADLRRDAQTASLPDGVSREWKAAEIKFEVNAHSPAEFTAPLMKIEPEP